LADLSYNDLSKAVRTSYLSHPKFGDILNECATYVEATDTSPACFRAKPETWEVIDPFFIQFIPRELAQVEEKYMQQLNLKEKSSGNSSTVVRATLPSPKSIPPTHPAFSSVIGILHSPVTLSLVAATIYGALFPEGSLVSTTEKSLAYSLHILLLAAKTFEIAPRSSPSLIDSLVLSKLFPRVVDFQAGDELSPEKFNLISFLKMGLVFPFINEGSTAQTTFGMLVEMMNSEKKSSVHFLIRELFSILGKIDPELSKILSERCPSSVPDSLDKKRQLAKQKQAEMMKKFAAQRSEFMKTNSGQLLASDTISSDDSLGIEEKDHELDYVYNCLLRIQSVQMIRLE